MVSGNVVDVPIKIYLNHLLDTNMYYKQIMCTFEIFGVIYFFYEAKVIYYVIGICLLNN